MKVCTKCGEDKELSEFSKHRGKKDGLRSRCKLCECAVSKNYYKENTEKEIKRTREYQNKQTDYKEKNKNRMKIWNRNNPDKLKDRILHSLYNISLEQYNEMLLQQNNCCAICGNEFKNSKDAHIDHNHLTGKVRKILCHKCNLGIGLFQDDITYLYNAIRYLQEN